MAKQPRLPDQTGASGDPWHTGEMERVEHFAAGAADYAKAQGLTNYSQAGIAATRANPNVTLAIGKDVKSQQGDLGRLTPELAESYGHLIHHIGKQFDHLTGSKESGGMGINVEFTPDDPYTSATHLRDSVRETGTLKALSTEATGGMAPGHPMTNEDNDKFRAVHDAFGHLATGRSFSRHGEEGALQHHARTMPKEAHPALMAELRGQNSFLNSYGDFPGNQVYTVPKWASAQAPTVPGGGGGKRFRKQGEQLTLF